ncbi:MAG: cyclic pyranopterin monophosphate synthase accessory protein [Planctomycetota bacterium]|nr:MAG: cyclic pyranopterin monophosphate synthase accessory protein [Planctomycetota bacterium]
MTDGLSHIDDAGAARMVHVGDKPLTARRAAASARLSMSARTLQLALEGGGPKGPVLEIARLAGIQAAKRTAELIPLCHQLPLDGVDVEIRADSAGNALCLRAEAFTTWRTGVEMEALTAVSVAGLTLIDMLKAVQKDMVLGAIQLESKSGGRSGTWTRASAASPET